MARRFESLSVEGTSRSSARMMCHLFHCGSIFASINDSGNVDKKDGREPPLSAIVKVAVGELLTALRKDLWMRGWSELGMKAFVGLRRSFAWYSSLDCIVDCRL